MICIREEKIKVLDISNKLIVLAVFLFRTFILKQRLQFSQLIFETCPALPPINKSTSHLSPQLWQVKL